MKQKNKFLSMSFVFLSSFLLASCTLKQPEKIVERKIDISILRDRSNWSKINNDKLVEMMQYNVNENDHFEQVALYFGSSSENNLFYYTVDELNQRVDHLYSWDSMTNEFNEIKLTNINGLFNIHTYNGQLVYLIVSDEQNSKYEWRILLNDEEIMQGKVDVLSQLPMMASYQNSLIVHTTTPTIEGVVYHLFKKDERGLTEIFNWSDEEYGSLHVKDIITSDEQIAFVMNSFEENNYNVTSMVLSDEEIYTSKLITKRLPYNTIILANELIYFVPEISEESPYLRSYDKCRYYISTNSSKNSQRTNQIGDCVNNLIRVDENNAIGIKNNILSIYYKESNNDLVVQQIDLTAWLPEFTIPLDIAVVNDQLIVFPSGIRSNYFFMELVDLFQ